MKRIFCVLAILVSGLVIAPQNVSAAPTVSELAAQAGASAGTQAANTAINTDSFNRALSSGPSVGKGLVPCGTGNSSPCTTCHLVSGVKGIIDWGMSVMTFFAIAIIVAMGIMYIISGANPALMTTAKNGIKTTLTGFAIMLGSWVIINFFMVSLANNGIGHATNWYTFTCDTASSAKQVTGVDTTSTAPVTAQNLPAGCNNYKDDFAAAGADACLLEGIAAAESGCNPNSATSDHGACGMMQMLPSTAGKDCAYLSSHPKESIQLAANYLSTLRSQLSSYSGQFNIGEDDLIAAYNAGTSDNVNGSSKKAFALSSDCTSVATPAWQCPINAGGFSVTQKYVKDVQSYKASCK